MPKVSQEYFDDKKRIILEAAMRVFQKKPAYSVTMKDIIKESGLSQGGVYKYYSNIDYIVAALLNTSNITTNPKELLDMYKDDPEKSIFELFDAFRKFFFITEKELGKIMFELQAFFFNNKERLKVLRDNINKNLIPHYWFSDLFRFIDKKIDEKYFKPILKPNDIYMQMMVAFSGIGNKLILNKYYDLGIKTYYIVEEEKKYLNADLNSLIDTSYKTLLLLLGSKNVNKYSFKN
ncbi:TetR/AcrR family transcriptional regulator [uncultured Brachyspira sp.]|uniref:TetR/AcrR family transcriptional regulator n=1 Tax=uncultured Brachyspira sp. TaxID=221953 RepID=UPI0025DEFC01|nr:helix-turn-helix domain-containing protein [uncultured Brachyspira sp.]